MTDSLEYSSKALFALPLAAEKHRLPRVFGGPARYVQGPGVIDQCGHYLSRLGFKHSAVLGSSRCLASEGRLLLASLAEAGISTHCTTFGGECSLQEINGQRDELRDLATPVDSLVVIGGGKTVDAGRAIAQRLALPLAVIPSLASNDAPCAAVSVIYTPEGETADAEIYDSNPDLVLVDTQIIAAGGERYLVAGMGDSMATWYEARATAANPQGINVFGSQPTLAATALARLCADTLYTSGEHALKALREHSIDEHFERVVEANVLLSGLGYESGGIAASHAVAQGYTMLGPVHQQYLHGEMVAMGVLTQLCMEGDLTEAERVGQFFKAVGLPITLNQIGLSRDDRDALDTVAGAALSFPFLGNMPFEVTRDKVQQSILQADALGSRLSASA